MKLFAKKILAFAVALVLVIAPMAVSAAELGNVIYSEGNYAQVDVYLSEGTAEYALVPEFDYTIFTYAPTETGKYTFAVEGGLCEIVSYNAMWVSLEPSAETVTNNSTVWECTGVGQEIWLAVISDSDNVNITVELAGAAYTGPEYIYYENVTEVAPYVFDGDVNELVAVNTMNSTVDTAVLGEDGYYHLNSADGPILLCNLSDTKMSLESANSYGQLKHVIYGDDGKALTVIAYIDAFTVYAENADEKTRLYPLTDDLIEILKKVGESQSWYGADGWVGGKFDDAWMYCCYAYTPAEPEYMIGDVNGDGVINGKDSNTLKQILSGSVSLTEEMEIVCDMHKDGNVNGMDANILSRYISGEISGF